MKVTNHVHMFPSVNILEPEASLHMVCQLVRCEKD